MSNSNLHYFTLTKVVKQFPRPLRERVRVRGKNALTLAEVLITLGIIGVVAAMTVPTLIQRNWEKQRVSQLKKTYSLIQQAYNMARMKYGEYPDWNITKTYVGRDPETNEITYDYSGIQVIAGYFKENLKHSKELKRKKSNWYDLDGNLWSKFDPEKNSNESIVYLDDGSALNFGWVDGSGFDIYVYYPGCEKRGCKLGKDLFYFRLDKNGTIIPYGLPEAFNNVTFEDNCKLKTNASNATNGRGCTAWVLYNENMDYLHCSNLSWDGKRKCK